MHSAAKTINAGPAQPDDTRAARLSARKRRLPVSRRKSLRRAATATGSAVTSLEPPNVSGSHTPRPEHFDSLAGVSLLAQPSFTYLSNDHPLLRFSDHDNRPPCPVESQDVVLSGCGTQFPDLLPNIPASLDEADLMASDSDTGIVDAYGLPSYSQLDQARIPFSEPIASTGSETLVEATVSSFTFNDDDRDQWINIVPKALDENPAKANAPASTSVVNAKFDVYGKTESGLLASSLRRSLMAFPPS